MRNEYRHVLERRAAIVAEDRPQIVETFARRDGDCIHTALTQCLDQAVRAGGWTRALVARHLVHRYAALAQCLGEQIAAAFAAKHDRASIAYIGELRQREHTFAVERRDGNSDVRDRCGGECFGGAWTRSERNE